MIKKSKKEEIGTISTLKNEKAKKSERNSKKQSEKAKNQSEKAKNQSEETVFFSGILALFGYA